ncbi:ABC transporter permease subunit [Mycoplasmopsis ciconiae]|uniref:ABC transporter permease subunit n=1 Tax=Mycoplasmopsis ciconiae TaxID=561067 RepID=A0ABU7MM81_9BACT|nr:ABC transporter permease subunit [Mycoplasmopsis ciconiae]
MSKNLYQPKRNYGDNNFVTNLSKNTFLKRFFAKKTSYFFLGIFLVCLLTFIISLFLNSQPFKNLAYLRLNINVLPIFENNIKEVKIDQYNLNTTQKELINILQKNNVSYQILNSQLGVDEDLVFNLSDLFEKLKIDNYAIFGTDNFGNDVFIYTNQLMLKSFLVAFVLFICEFILGLFLGLLLIQVNEKISIVFIKIIHFFNSFPDILVILVFFVLTSNYLVVYLLIFILGWFRVVYWAYEYGLKEYNKQYVDSLLASNIPFYSILYKHILPNIFAQILILFARRVSYIIFFIATLNLLGYDNTNNVATIFQKNWAYKFLNKWQIIYPALILTIFLINWQLLMLNIADSSKVK